jgi:hypothetical protein
MLEGKGHVGVGLKSGQCIAKARGHAQRAAVQAGQAFRMAVRVHSRCQRPSCLTLQAARNTRRDADERQQQQHSAALQLDDWARLLHKKMHEK